MMQRPSSFVSRSFAISGCGGVSSVPAAPLSSGRFTNSPLQTAAGDALDNVALGDHEDDQDGDARDHAAGHYDSVVCVVGVLQDGEPGNWGRGYSGRGTVPVSPLPEMVGLRADVMVVDPSYPLHRLLGEGWHSRSGHIVLDLLGTLRAGDSAGDRRVHQDPAQSQLRQRIPHWHQFLQLLRGPQAGLEVHAGEGLAPVEGLALAVEVAVIVG